MHTGLRGRFAGAATGSFLASLAALALPALAATRERSHGCSRRRDGSGAGRAFKRACLLALLLLVPPAAFATAVPFAPPSTISTAADSAFSVFAADVDGDGDVDALSASFVDNKIAWYENDGASPPLWTARTISTAADGARSVFAADVDGDGDVDALSASFNDDKIAWYDNNGASPPLWTARTISTAADAANLVFAADVDGDGDVDALSASFNDDKIAWYENLTIRRHAVFPAQSLIGIADMASSVFAADVDDDGDVDALSASFNDDKIAWYENSGAVPPVFTPRTISTAAAGAKSVFAADVDGDGDMDALSASELDDKIAWYENNGASPPVWTARTISTAANGANLVFAADVDGDGDVDALSASEFDDTIAWYENNGASPPAWTARTISTAAAGARSVFAADVDGDGDVDALSASFNDDTIAWYENNGASPPLWTARTISTAASGAKSVFAADVNDDGDMDVLSASFSGATIAWYENDGAAPPVWNARTISTAAFNANSVFAADVDSDGDLDVLSALYSDSTIAWYENDGAAPPVWNARTISAAAEGAVSVFAADIDDDGDLDALSASAVDSKIAWYENQPAACSPASCDTGNTCVDSSCDAGGNCVFTPDDTNTCSDGNACTAPDVCRSGACVCDNVGPCPAGTVTNFTNATPVAIPTGPGVVSSTITVGPGLGPFLNGVQLTTNILHTNNADLDITLTSPSGTVVTITSDNSGVNDNVFNGTLWDDKADPANQVPFPANTFAASNLVTDTVYTNLVVKQGHISCGILRGYRALGPDLLCDGGEVPAIGRPG